MRSIILLSLFSFLPTMGMFKPSNFFVAFACQRLYPKYQKQRPARLQNVSIKNQAERTKATRQKIKTKDLQQQKEMEGPRRGE